MKTQKTKSLNFEAIQFKNENARTRVKGMRTICLTILSVILLGAVNVQAQTPLFSQNFTSSSTLSSYINSSSPSNGQFNAITVSGGPTATITSNALQFVRSGAGTASFSRTTNLSPVPLGIIYKFDLTVVNSSSTGTVARWQVGAGFSTSNSAENDNDCYAQFAIDFRGSSKYRINDIKNGDTYADIAGSVKTITWVLNKSGNTLSYNAPDGTVKTVSNDRTDLWVGTTKYISGKSVDDNANIEDLKFVFSNSTGTITMDNITITQFIPVVTSQPAASLAACAGISASFSATASGLPSPTVKWQKNISSVWTDISGATATTYTISSPVVGDAGQYRALFTNTEGSTASTTSTLTVSASPNGGSVTANATVCSGSNSGTLTLGGNSGTVQKWQSSTNGGSNWNDISNTSTSQAYTNLSATTMYRAVVVSAGCTANSSAATITVNPLPTIYTLTGGGTFCIGGLGAAIGLSDSQSGVNYQLVLAGVDNGSSVAGTGNAISFGNRNGIGSYTVMATNAASGCKSTMAGTASVSTTSLPSVSLANTASPTCYDAVLTATNSGGTLGPVSATNSNSFAISSSGTPTITSSITMPSGLLSAASNITLTMNIDHSRVGNLVATLISPSCGQTILFNRPGGTSNQDNLLNSSNYVFTSASSTTFPGSNSGDVPTGTYKATFSGLTFPCSTVGGVWTLQIEDKENGGGGDLDSWTLSISNAGGYTTVFSGPASIAAVSYSAYNVASTLVTPPTGSNTYSAITTDALGCVSAPSNTVNVLINPTVIINTQPTSQQTCSGGTSIFSVVASGTGLNYQWRKGSTNLTNGGRFSGATSASLSISNVSASDNATNYNVLITDASCTASSSNVSLTVNELPQTPSVNPTNSTMLAGNVQALTASALAINAVLGTGTSTNNSTSYPAPLGTYYGGARHQILILASELSDQGIVAGEQITSLSFDVSNTNNAHPMINYTISLGNTNLSSLSSTFVTGLSQTFFSASYAALSGLNKFDFTSPFVWNGTSNIIIETVYNNNYLGTSTNPNCSVNYTSSSFTSVNYSRKDNAGVGNAPIIALSSNGTSSRRPNMILGHKTLPNLVWSPTAGLFTDLTANNAYSGGNAAVVYAKPAATTTYSVNAVSQVGCNSNVATSVVNVITTPPNCVVPSVNTSCITNTTITWPAATGYPAGYYLTVYDNTLTYLAFQYDLGNVLSYSNSNSLFPMTFLPNTVYNYVIEPYNSNGFAACSVLQFTSGASITVAPAAATQVTPTVSYAFGAEGVTPPAFPCGIITEDFDGLGNSSWHTAAIAPKSGVNHLRITKNSDGVTGLDDWFFSVPIHVVKDKVYNISWYDRIASGSTQELYNVYIDFLPEASTMSGGTPQNFSSNSTTYSKKSWLNDYVAMADGEIYIGFRAISPAGPAQGSLYIDDITVDEVLVTRVKLPSCKTYLNEYDKLYIDQIQGATNYRYKIKGKTGNQVGYNFEHYRNNGSPDYRLKWAPGLVFNTTYDISVAYYKNGSWSSYGPTCEVALGNWPAMKLRNNPATPGLCDYSISDLNYQLFTDSMSGANSYAYRIVEDTPGGYEYNQDWNRNNANLDFRLVWAYQAAPLVIERVRFGYKYDVQTAALVGKSNSTFGNRPGLWSPFTGQTCKLDLTASSPTTALINCTGINLVSLNDQIFTTPVGGATNYQYEFTEQVSGNVNTVTRGNGNTDYRLTWIPSNVAPGGARYGVTYSVRVKAFLGGVWLNYSASCPVTTPSSVGITTMLLGVCGTTLSAGQFNMPIAITPVTGASNYAFRITGSFTNGGTQRIVYRNNSNANLYLSSTFQAANLPNMKANTPYTIEVAYFAGVWSDFGPACGFTTGGTIPRYSPFENQGEEVVGSLISMNIYPNPSNVSEQLSMELQGITSANEKVQVSIYNLLGNKVYRAEVITKEEAIVTIKPEVNLAAGVYMAEALLNGAVYKTKFVVK